MLSHSEFDTQKRNDDVGRKERETSGKVYIPLLSP
jgi:hypothetical protein